MHKFSLIRLCSERAKFCSFFLNIAEPVQLNQFVIEGINEKDVRRQYYKKPRTFYKEYLSHYMQFETKNVFDSRSQIFIRHRGN